VAGSYECVDEPSDSSVTELVVMCMTGLEK
jgi:hypothetical protein